MPRYYFHISNTGQTTIDDEGMELAGPDEARTHAIVSAGESLKEYGSKFWSGPELRIWVTDEAATIICTLRISADF